MKACRSICSLCQLAPGGHRYRGWAHDGWVWFRYRGAGFHAVPGPGIARAGGERELVESASTRTRSSAGGT